MQIWIQYCMATQVDGIQDLFQDDMTITPYLMDLKSESIEDLYDALTRINMFLLALHWVMGMQIFAILLKFFKAFQSNPRLLVVTNTLMTASVDLLHFGIVFVAVFIGFAAAGHVLFGDELLEFNSLGRSVDTTFRTVLGEFGWYDEWAIGDVYLGSGVPFIFLAGWFWLFMTFLFLVLMNMLLAIIMEHYAGETEKVNQAAEVPTLIQQTVHYVQDAKQTKGFIPLSTIVSGMEDSDSPAHPEPVVTAESLLAAFPKMQKKQAEFIMDFLIKDAIAKAKAEADAGNIQLLHRLSHQIETTHEELRHLVLSNALANERVKKLINSLDEMKVRIDAISGRRRSQWGANGPKKEILAKLDELGPKIQQISGKGKEKAHGSGGVSMNMTVGFEPGRPGLQPFDMTALDTLTGVSSISRPTPSVCCTISSAPCKTVIRASP
eukprot:gnl/TRDRNA2_/TRDRNA2_172135_c1_seq2.p1 gnl/TRDRNA2_/TRDRNA2_172135_c1~~gnl/TRDRNA2_/TRDRNA2_172135_c1_seq2.p1  ORF type:complete len:437 (-),score=80.49 gnl/TRDRNA2_/TRDRNA2_172135_c1_seq2:98-1408(-)